MTFFCRHHELPHRLPDGTLRLRCANCGHERDHLLYGPAPAFHRTQEGGELSGNSGELTGIEREAARDERLERQARYADIGARVRRKGFQVVARRGGTA